MNWRKCWTFLRNKQSAALGTALCLFASTINAQDITVTSQEGALTVEGQFIGYDGTYLQIETRYGPLTLLYANVVCAGDACPPATGYIPQFRLAGAEKMTRVLLPGLLQSYALSLGHNVETVDGDDGQFTMILRDDAGAGLATFAFRATSTSEGFADLITHQADLVLAGRRVSDDEVARAAEVGIGALNSFAQRRIVGLDPLIFVGPASGAAVDLAKIETLHVMNVGLAEAVGFDADMLVAHQDRTAFDAALLQPDSIGMISLSERSGRRALPLVDACRFLVAPDIAGFKTLDYPFANPVYIYAPERRQHPVMRGFLTWLDTPAAQRVVRRAGFVDQDLDAISLGDQGQRLSNAIRAAGAEVPLGELQRMLRVLGARTRLTQSYRFEEGTTRLDALSLSGLRRLARGINAGDFAGQDIMFVGFTDGRGAATANRDLSSARAEEVKRSLLRLLDDVLPDDVSVQSAAFGEALPVGCDTTDRGRLVNRRVELWIAPQG